MSCAVPNLPLLSSPTRDRFLTDLLLHPPTVRTRCYVEASSLIFSAAVWWSLVALEQHTSEWQGGTTSMSYLMLQQLHENSTVKAQQYIEGHATESSGGESKAKESAHSKNRR